MQAKGNVMNGRLERVYAELSAVLLSRPELKNYLAEQSRIAAKNMVLRLDSYLTSKDDCQYRNRVKDNERRSLNVLRFQGFGTIPPQSDVQHPRIIEEIRNRELSEADRALVLTAIYNKCVGEDLQIDPFADALRFDPIGGSYSLGSLDQRARILFSAEAYDENEDGFGLDPRDAPSLPIDSPLQPADEALLLLFVSNLKNVVLDQQSEPSSPKLFLEARTPAVSTSEADFVQFPEHQTSPVARRGKRAADPTREELVKRRECPLNS